MGRGGLSDERGNRPLTLFSGCQLVNTRLTLVHASPTSFPTNLFQFAVNHDHWDRRVVIGKVKHLSPVPKIVLGIFLDDLGFDISRRRVTLSTSGLVPQIYKLAEEVNCALAVSLHAPNDELRSQLVPINRKHNIAELLEACWHYLDEQNGRSVTFEYVMLDGVNDQPEHARELARLLRGKPAKLNLIPFNPFPGTQYRRSPQAAIERFRDELMQRDLIVTIRKTRGDDIDAACGQLAGQVTDRTVVRLGSKTFGLQVRA